MASLVIISIAQKKPTKPEKDHNFIWDYSTVYSKNTSFAIKEYLEKSIYPEKITSLDYQKQ